MEYRELGKTGVKVSAVGFGCWAMGGVGWGKVDDKESADAVNKAVDLGITFFDTAPSYGLGHSEQVLGKALGNRRKDVFLATKCGVEWDDKGEVWVNNSPAYVRKDCERSLNNLGCDKIDLLQVHWPDKSVPIADTIGEMAKLQKEGKIRFIGLCNLSVEQVKEARKHADIASFQIPYSMLSRNVEVEYFGTSTLSMIKFCEQQGIGVIACSCLQQGLLTGKFKEDSKFAEEDIRANSPLFTGDIFKIMVKMAEGIKGVVFKQGCTTAQFAINWVLQNSAVSVALAGMKRPSQAEENAGGANCGINEEGIREVNKIFQIAMEESRTKLGYKWMDKRS